MPNYSLHTPYLFLIGVLVIGLALVFIQFQPLIVQINGLRDDIALLETDIREQKSFLQTLDRKRAELASYPEHERRLAVMLPLSAQLEDMVRIVQDAASQSGGHLLRFVDQSAQAEQELNAQRSRGDVDSGSQFTNPLAANVELAGSWGQVRSFLRQLASAPRLIDVQRLTVRARDDVPDRLQLESQLSFYMYQQPKN